MLSKFQTREGILTSMGETDCDERGKGEEAFPTEINFVPGPPAWLAHSALPNQTLIVKKAPEGGRKEEDAISAGSIPSPWNCNSDLSTVVDHF